MISFKKITSVLASAVMLSSTVGFAVAASYPAPFVVDGLADAAVVYGANAAISDITNAINVQQKLGALATSGSATTGASVTGEAVSLFSGGTKIYINDSLNSVKTVLTKSDLPTVLATSTFSGIVDAKLTQTIDIGSNPRVTFGKQPTSSNDPEFSLQTSTSTSNYIYNATVTFDRAVDFNNASSEGEELKLFGQRYTVASATDGTNLVLLQSAEKLALDSDNPTADVTIADKTYTIELVSSSDTSATIKVTNSEGKSESKEVNEAASKKINGVTVAVTNADETNLKLSASIVAGSEKITLTSGSAVTRGDDNTVVDGTNVFFTGGTTAMTRLVVSVSAADSDKDAIRAGESFVDPVFKTFKVNFAGFNILEDSTSRESIKIRSSGDDKMEVTFADHRGKEVTNVFAKNSSVTKIELMRDDDFRNITVKEMGALKYQEYAVVGNENKGYLLRLSAVKNQSTGYSNDYVKFTDIFSGDTLESTITAEGSGTLAVGGNSYTVTYTGDSSGSSESYNVRLNYPDTAGNNVVVYPTIQTIKGAKVAFYEPLTIDLANWDGSNNLAASLQIPDGDGYTGITLASHTTGADRWWNVTFGTTLSSINTTAGGSASGAIGQLNYNVTFAAGTASNTTTVYLRKPTGGNINDAGLIILEEKDDNSVYEAMVVILEPGTTGDDGIGIDDIERTWSGDGSAWEATMASDSKKTKEGDLWGTILTLDSSDSDQKSAIINYPDEQLYAQLYAAEVAAAITPGTPGKIGGGQVLIVKDSEVSSVASKNLFVVGGSCINSVAAKILGSDSPLCTTDFTVKTEAGAGQYIIKSVVSPYNDNKIALLVAGYEAADTVNAVNKALEGVATDSGKSQVYPIVTTG